MAALVDTNVLVYRFDRRFPNKQRIATDVLRGGIACGTVRLAHQTVVEFVAAVTRPLAGGMPLLDLADATHEADGGRASSVGHRDPSFTPIPRGPSAKRARFGPVHAPH